MLSPCYVQMKDEEVVNITFTDCMKAIIRVLTISFTLFFAGDEAHLQGQPLLHLLKASSGETPMGISRGPLKMHGHPSSPSVLHGGEQRNASMLALDSWRLAKPLCC